MLVVVVEVVLLLVEDEDKEEEEEEEDGGRGGGCLGENFTAFVAASFVAASFVAVSFVGSSFRLLLLRRAVDATLVVANVVHKSVRRIWSDGWLSCERTTNDGHLR